PMGFTPGGVWIMEYCSFMGYDMHFPANQLGGPKMLWGIREYGLHRLWVTGSCNMVCTKKNVVRHYDVTTCQSNLAE
ncbi:hypothetical protein BYT27DRAFT_7106159, partial [Phlegmacium glaucopus]